MLFLVDLSGDEFVPNRPREVLRHPSALCEGLFVRRLQGRQIGERCRDHVGLRLRHARDASEESKDFAARRILLQGEQAIRDGLIARRDLLLLRGDGRLPLGERHLLRAELRQLRAGPRLHACALFLEGLLDRLEFGPPRRDEAIFLGLRFRLGFGLRGRRRGERKRGFRRRDRLGTVRPGRRERDLLLDRFEVHLGEIRQGFLGLRCDVGWFGERRRGRNLFRGGL